MRTNTYCNWTGIVSQFFFVITLWILRHDIEQLNQGELVYWINNMNMENVTYLTKSGLKKLEDELTELTTVRRAEVAARLHQAQEDGDLIENAEYEAAKNEQSFVEGRIVTLQSMLSTAAIIKKGKNDGVAKMGSTVVVQENNSVKESFVIVGATESDPSEGLISNESPLGQALLGASAGDEVVVTAPAGDVTYHIMKVK